MQNLPIIIPARPRRRRRKHSTTSGVAMLNLVAATYEVGNWVQLAFDRAIDPSGVDGSQIVVADATDSRKTWKATGTITIVNPTTVRFGLNNIGDAVGSTITLDASATNGIVAADDAVEWAGS